MKAYLINPFEKSVKEVEYSGDIEDIYLHLNCDIFDCCYPFDNQNCVFIDDEGLLKPDQSFFTIGKYSQPLAGMGLVLGTDENGDSIGAIGSISDLNVRWVKFALIAGDMAPIEEAYAP